MYDIKFSLIGMKLIDCTQPPQGRFTADILADVIAQCIFGTKKSGMALNPYTKDIFDPLPPNIIMLAVVGIGHGIREYEFGQKKVAQFDGLVEEGKSH